MRIAQIAPLSESCPPKFYGGTERIVSYLTEELVRQGHDVTLFASGDSETRAHLVPTIPVAARLDARIRDTIPHYVMALDTVVRRAENFDILHFHIDFFQYLLARQPFSGKVVTTLHGRLDLPDLQPFYRAFPDLPLVSISDNQRLPMPPMAWAGTVYHGLPLEGTVTKGEARPGEYLAFLGRISPEKRPDRAIEIAVRSGRPLRIAAKVDAADQRYWDEVIGPLVKANPNVEFIGEIGDFQKSEFLGNACALLFPIDWPEPFGLVMIEAMSCGTPVIAFRCGSVPEVIEDGVTGRIVETVEDAVAAVGDLGRFDRAVIRRRFEERFSVARMARDYVRIYQTLIEGTGKAAFLSSDAVLQNVA